MPKEQEKCLKIMFHSHTQIFPILLGIVRNIVPLFISWQILRLKTNSWLRIYYFSIVKRKDVEYYMTNFYFRFKDVKINLWRLSADKTTYFTDCYFRYVEMNYEPPWDTSCIQSVYLKLHGASLKGFLCLRELSWDLRRMIYSLREHQRKLF